MADGSHSHGKLWTIDEEQRLMEHSELSNHDLAQLMGRTANAVRYRRNHIAVKLHQSRPEVSLDECVQAVGGDLEQAKLLLEQWRDNQVSLSSFIDSRKRKGAEPERFEFHRVVPNVRPAKGPGRVEPGWSGRPEAERIQLVCASIREEEGRLAGLWRDPELAPCLVQHYAGFDAYAKAVQGWSAAGHGN
jgi:hypothetical protein